MHHLHVVSSLERRPSYDIITREKINDMMGRKFFSFLLIINVLTWIEFISHDKNCQPDSAAAAAVAPKEDRIRMQQFLLFGDDLIPSHSIVDVNIGTNDTPMRSRGHHRILIEPLFHVCESNVNLTAGENVTFFCFAVSNYTGFATFREYNAEHGGVSSSLAEVDPGTSHGIFSAVSKRTVFVLEALTLFSAIHEKGSRINRLKLDLQGHELRVIQNIQSLLRDTNLVTHIMAECFFSNDEGKQIYHVENSCLEASKALLAAGYETRVVKTNTEWGDLFAFKRGLASDFLVEEDFSR